jgi:hypothetical protein
MIIFSFNCPVKNIQMQFKIYPKIKVIIKQNMFHHFKSSEKL